MMEYEYSKNMIECDETFMIRNLREHLVLISEQFCPNGFYLAMPCNVTDEVVKEILETTSVVGVIFLDRNESLERDYPDSIGYWTGEYKH